MTDLPPSDRTSTLREYTLTHVFFPVELPERSDYTLEKDQSLLQAVCSAAHAYSSHVSGTSEAQWRRITKMLDNLHMSVQSECLDKDYIVTQLRAMETGDILTFFIRRQNVAVVITKRDDSTLYESFEVSPSRDAVENAGGPLTCSYPSSAVRIPDKVFRSTELLSELAGLLSRSSTSDTESVLSSLPPHSESERLILLPPTILRYGRRVAHVSPITKHVRDEAGWQRDDHEVEDVWRRSSLWLLTRIAIQMSFDRSPVGRASYKQFILFLVCTLAADHGGASSDMHHLMACKILRRLSKLRPSPESVPEWLFEMALKTCADIRETRDARWKPPSPLPSPFLSPSQDELARDTQPFVLNSHEYIRSALANHDHSPVIPPFEPDHHRRGTIEDFFSSNGTFFEEAYEDDPDVTLYDVEQAVEQEIDDWVACASAVDGACAQIEHLMDKYMDARSTSFGKSEGNSIMLLTGIELFVAVDKLATREIPMLADYSPEIPLGLLEKLCLRKRSSLHRLACAYQYLAGRHSRSRTGWSVLSHEFTKDSFPVRYYDCSPHLQQLKARLEEDRVRLPDSPVLSKVIVFELQCPASIRAWRSTIPRILHYMYPFYIQVDDLEKLIAETEENLLAHCPDFQPYLIDRDHLSRHVEIQLVYVPCSQSKNKPALHYALRFPDGAEESLTIWKSKHSNYDEQDFSFHLDSDLGYWQWPGAARNDLAHYVSNTSYKTCNDILAAQADCPTDFTLDEFIAFAQLRSGGLLQWLNILQALRGRLLNFRRHEVHYLLIHAAFQVGPLDLATGMWLWHQELQDPSFCDALVDALESLFLEARAGSIDVMTMNTITLLLTRILASCPSGDVSNRIITLIRRIRRKTFSWVEELWYNLAMAPTNEERGHLLLDMALTCRSTFDVDSAVLLPQLLHSAEDVDTLLSCALFIHALRPGDFDRSDRLRYLLLQRDRRISLTVEAVTRDAILADPSEYGIDLAILKMFGHYQPGIQQWEQLEHPNLRWLTCKTNVTRSTGMDQSLHVVHLDLLFGELIVDGQPLGGLPREIRAIPECQQIFHDQGFLIIPSELPGMDFTTHVTERKHKVHYSLRDGILVLRAQCNGTRDILELIPPYIFWKDLPPGLINDHVHWLNLTTSTIEIRPLKRLWEPFSDDWKIDCKPGQYRIFKGHTALVNIRSPTWAIVSKHFGRLNNVQGLPNKFKNILITTSPVDSGPNILSALQLSVALPHYSLSFFVNAQGELESRDFKDMVYDENQCVGALFGLQNLLVLRPGSSIYGTLVQDALIHRRILIPNGFPKDIGDHQIQVHIELAHSKLGPSLCQRADIFCHSYEVETELGRFMGNRNLMSMRYLAHLHVMTSHNWPDPLTGKTGAQAALCLLQSAGCRSVMKPKVFDEDDIRRFYHLRGIKLPPAVFLQVSNRDKFWRSTRYPQINAAYEEILQHRHYWNPTMYVDRAASTALERALHRAALIFPSNVNRTNSMDRRDDKDSNGPHQDSLQGSVSNGKRPLQITLDWLLRDRPAPPLPSRTTLLRESPEYNITLSAHIPALDQLFSLLQPEASFPREYITHLDSSARAFVDQRSTSNQARRMPIEVLKSYYAQCRGKYLDALSGIKNRLGPTADAFEQTLYQFGQWPLITSDNLLQCLASTSLIDLPPSWKKCLTSLALLLLDLQRSRRLLKFALNGLEEQFSKELDNEPRDSWKPEEYPDWLLIQIDGNFLIRRSQAEIAMELMSPPSGGNTVMQVNMGDGKSSVIIPIAAAALADTKQLVRVIVPKALTAQMFDLLVNRLGGLANRPIYHLPFSRTPEYDHNKRLISLDVNNLHKLMVRCMNEGGILLVQPEHIAALKLTNVEEQMGKLDNGGAANQSWTRRKLQHWMSKRSLARLSMKPVGKDEDHNQRTNPNSQGGLEILDSASKWRELQTWIDAHARDILDESDEILHTRFHLIYTLGRQRHMDGYPDRWSITQQVLRLVKKHVHPLSRRDSMEYECGPSGSFPYVRILSASDVGSKLISLIVNDVMAGQLPGFDFYQVPAALHDAIKMFIANEDISQLPDTLKKVEDYAKSSYESHLWSGLLIIRGLLASNILLFALSEWRWRVNYGLASHSSRSERSGHATARTLLAVPYRAKDEPAPSSQFGHPDITIILTCLSYYYAGLSEEQLRASFEILLDEDDPSVEYACWVKEFDHRSLPESLWKLHEINLRSSEQWDKVIFPRFRRIQAVIDFYLSRVVFPKEATEYPQKISYSGWDLTEEREKLVTGFSGTNDGRWLLPLSITQRDLPHQQGSNARVLAYLVQPENNFYAVTGTTETREQWNTRHFLQMMATQAPEIRILLDVGAQILDFSNRQVAEAWLNIARHISGAIYFNDKDELMILSREGTTHPMAASPLSQQLERCVVYLDHAHTRGTDLTMPIGSRAAVTLGPKVTKDSLVQGCMRMRKLGNGHSLMFFAPLEVDCAIRAVTGKKDPKIQVTTVDVLCWAIHETWIDIQRRAPSWAQQGMNHKSRHEAWKRFRNNEITSNQLSDTWLQQERKSLVDLYAPNDNNINGSELELDQNIGRRCKMLGVLSLRGVELEEAQEREVNREREREREVELPPMAEPVAHSIHRGVVHFVKTGNIPLWYRWNAFEHPFKTLEETFAAGRNAIVQSSSILATKDFCRTVNPKSTQGTMDQYLRPVQWVLSRTGRTDRNQMLVLLSPFEVSHLLPDIRASKHVHLHVYAARTSQRMKNSDDLKLYTIPPLPSDWTPPWPLIDQLNLFAGQLYLTDHESYIRVRDLLGIATKKSPIATRTKPIRRKLMFGRPEASNKSGNGDLDSVYSLVAALLGIRTRGRPITHTHMGKILRGEQLKEEDFVSRTSDESLLNDSPSSFGGKMPHNVPSSKIPDPSPASAQQDFQGAGTVLAESAGNQTQAVAPGKGPNNVPPEIVIPSRADRALVLGVGHGHGSVLGGPTSIVSVHASEHVTHDRQSLHRRKAVSEPRSPFPSVAKQSVDDARTSPASSNWPTQLPIASYNQTPHGSGSGTSYAGCPCIICCITYVAFPPPCFSSFAFSFLFCCVLASSILVPAYLSHALF